VRKNIGGIEYSGSYCGQISNGRKNGCGVEYIRGSDLSSIFYNCTYKNGEIVQGIQVIRDNTDKVSMYNGGFN
jgi:hypothetical protein